MKRNSFLCLVVFVISFASLESAAQPQFELIVKYAKDLKWGTPDDIRPYGNWENNIVSQQNENSTSAGGVYRVLLTNTSKVENGKVRVSAADLPNSKLSCLMRTMSVRIEPVDHGDVVNSLTKIADVGAKWNIGGGEFPTESCILVAYFDVPEDVDEVRVMAQVRTRVGSDFYKQSVLKKAMVFASGTIELPEPDKRIVIKDLELSDPDADGVVQVEFKVAREGSDTHDDTIEVAISAHYAHCPAEDASQFCFLYKLKKCGYYFFPTTTYCRSASQKINYTIQDTHEVVDTFDMGPGPNSVTERSFTEAVPYHSLDVACKKNDEKCADLRVNVRTSALGEDPHFDWDNAFDQIIIDHEVVK